jgi:hypothetical protein
MLVLIDGVKCVGLVLLLINRVHQLFFLLFLFLLVMGIYPCDKEPISIVLNVLNI